MATRLPFPSAEIRAGLPARAARGVALAALAAAAGALGAAGSARALELQGHGRGIPAPQFPTAAGVASASGFLGSRAGHTAFAVVDSAGRLAGERVHDRFHSASLIKAMLLVAYLQMLDGQGRSLDSSSRALLYPMIHVSDNGAASAVFAAVGNSGLNRVAREAGMSEFTPGGAFWGFSQISAADQARFFFMQDHLIPSRFDGYARDLLSGIASDQSWGIPTVARPRYRTFFKGGWLPVGEGIVNQAARLEGRGLRFAIAVLSSGDPSMLYGEQTIEGVTARLLA